MTRANQSHLTRCRIFRRFVIESPPTNHSDLGWTDKDARFGCFLVFFVFSANDDQDDARRGERATHRNQRCGCIAEQVSSGAQIITGLRARILPIAVARSIALLGNGQPAKNAARHERRAADSQTDKPDRPRFVRRRLGWFTRRTFVA